MYNRVEMMRLHPSNHINKITEGPSPFQGIIIEYHEVRELISGFISPSTS
jgi:hypothetical protein